MDSEAEGTGGKGTGESDRVARGGTNIGDGQRHNPRQKPKPEMTGLPQASPTAILVPLRTADRGPRTTGTTPTPALSIPSLPIPVSSSPFLHLEDPT